MSRCTQAAPSTNSRSSSAALMEPACRPPLFFISATSLLMSGWYSANSGSSQNFSPARCPAWMRLFTSGASLPITPVQTLPRVVTMAPVRVAMSTRRVMPRCRARLRASASTSRPSASVLMISMVLPFIARTTSPGRCAEPPGIFSVAATMPVTLMRGRSCPRACIAPSTEAPPAISPFIDSIPAAGFSDMPPVSKVMPLPISPRLLAGFSGSPA